MDELKNLLLVALKTLGKEDSLEIHLQSLKADWYNSITDLQLALDDGQAWQDIQLPGRLKLELKRLLKNFISTSNVTVNKQIDNPTDKELTWFKCFSIDHNCFYYFNIKTSDSEWNPPNEYYEYDSFTKNLIEEYNKTHPNDLISNNLEDSIIEAKLLITYNNLNNSNRKEQLKLNNSDSSGLIKVGMLSPNLNGSMNTSVYDTSSKQLFDNFSRMPLTPNEISVDNIYPPLPPVESFQSAEQFSDVSPVKSSDSELEFVDAIDLEPSAPEINLNTTPLKDPQNVIRLHEMGFSTEAAIEALNLFDENLADATSYLLEKTKKRDLSRKIVSPSMTDNV